MESYHSVICNAFGSIENDSSLKIGTKAETFSLGFPYAKETLAACCGRNLAVAPSCIAFLVAPAL